MIYKSRIFEPKLIIFNQFYYRISVTDTIEYNPEHSTSSGSWPGWTLHRQTDLMKDIEENNSLKIDQDAYAAMIICQSICTHRWYRTDDVEYETVFHNQVMDIAQQWSEETKKNPFKKKPSFSITDCKYPSSPYCPCKALKTTLGLNVCNNLTKLPSGSSSMAINSLV